MSDKKKSCIGKHKHASRGKAEAHIRSLKRLNNAPDGAIYEPYSCIYCHGWHIGRVKTKGHKNKYNKEIK